MSQMVYTKDEFAKECNSRGYVGRDNGGKNAVLKWCKEHDKELYTEDDMIEVYRHFEKGGHYGYDNKSRRESWLCNVSMDELLERGYYNDR